MDWVWSGRRCVRAREEVRKGERVSERDVVAVYLAGSREVEYGGQLRKGSNNEM